MCKVCTGTRGKGVVTGSPTYKYYKGNGLCWMALQLQRQVPLRGFVGIGGYNYGAIYVVCILEDDLDLDVDFKVVAVALRDLLPDQAAQGDREVQEGMNVQKKKIPQRHFTGR